MARPQQFPPTLHTTPNGIDYIRVVVAGVRRTFNCGPHGSAESAQSYGRYCAELQAGHATGPRHPDLTVAELAAQWTATAPRRYRPDSREPREFGYALAPLLRLYAATPARDFGPKALKATRQAMIDAGISRKVINRRVARLKTLFKWAAEEELVPGSVYQDLRAVRALPPQTPGVVETAGVPTVTWAEVKRVYRHCPRIPGAMLLVQFFTGMRSEEVRLLRPCDLDRTGDVWTYRPERHKNRWRGQDRAVKVGPRAQRVLAVWLRQCRADGAYLFNPKLERRGRACNDHYSDSAYGLAVARGAKRAGVDCRAYSCRHSFRDRALEAGDILSAMSALGQRSSRAFDTYGGLNMDAATELAKKIG